MDMVTGTLTGLDTITENGSKQIIEWIDSPTTTGALKIGIREGIEAWAIAAIMILITTETSTTTTITVSIMANHPTGRQPVKGGIATMNNPRTTPTTSRIAWPVATALSKRASGIKTLVETDHTRTTSPLVGLPANHYMP